MVENMNHFTAWKYLTLNCQTFISVKLTSAMRHECRKMCFLTFRPQRPIKAQKLAYINNDKKSWIIICACLHTFQNCTILSAWTVKGNRKREIGQSPIKKKFKDFTISREDIDDAIANGIKLARKEQQSTLDSAMASTVRDAVDSVLTPALRELRADIKQTYKQTYKRPTILLKSSERSLRR